jgi:putative MATE family efflux protein
MSKDSKLQSFIQNPNISLWKLTIPMAVGLFVNSIYILVDTYFLGSKIGTSAISALGYVMPFYFIIMGITFGLSAGTTTMIAQYIGKEDKSKADLVAQNSILMALTFSVLIIILTYFFGEKLLALQGIGTEILALALEYFYVMAYGSTFLIFSIFIRAILIGEGESILPMSALGIGTIINIILDPFFIDYLGIKGAAYATIVSQVFVVSIFLYFIFIKKNTYVTFSFSRINFNFQIWKEIFHIGIPTSISMLIMSTGLFIMNSILIEDSHVAAYNLANRIENFVSLTLIALSSSQVTILGMFYGAKRFDLIKPMVRYTLIWSVLIASFFSIIIYYFIDDITPLFLTASSLKEIEMSNKAIHTTIQYFNVMIFVYPFIGITMVSTRAMQAIGKAWPMMATALFRVLILQCSMAYFFIKILGKDINWAWYSIGFACVLSAFFAYFMRVYFYNRLYNNLEG